MSDGLALLPVWGRSGEGEGIGALNAQKLHESHEQGITELTLAYFDASSSQTS